MNTVFCVLVAFMGFQAEGVKVRAIRRRLIEYPFEPLRQMIPVSRQPEYAQTVPINEEPRVFTYPDRNGIRYINGPTYGGSVAQNRRVIANSPNILWTNTAGPDLIRFSEGRPGQNGYNVDKSSRGGVKERINYFEETDTNSGSKEISLNPFEQRSEKEDQTNNSLGENKLSVTHSNQSNGTVDLSEINEAASGSVTGEIEISTDKKLADKVSGNDKQNNNPVSLLSTLSTAPGSEKVNTVDQSKLNVENFKKKSIRYVANKHYLLPPLSRRFYTVDEIKTDWENETSQINMENVNNTKEVPERPFISLDGAGKFSETQSEPNRASLKNIVNVLDATNDGNIAQVRLQSENDLVSPDNKNTYLIGLNNPGKENVNQFKLVKEENSSPDRFALANDQIYLLGDNKLNMDKKNPLKGTVQVINVANPKHFALIRLKPEDNATSTDAEINNSVNQESDENSLNENYTYDEKEGRHRLPIYLYRFGQNTYLYQPTDQNVPWKQLDINKLLQSRRVSQLSQAEPNAEKNSDICLACETLLKLLSKNPNILTQYGLLGDEKNKYTPTDGISQNYLDVEGKKEPISLEYYQPSTVITKTGNENNRRMNTEKELVDIYGYDKLKYPQILSPVKLTGDKLDLIIPKPQGNPQYDSKEDNKNFLLTLVADEPNGEILQTQHVSNSKEDSARRDEVSASIPKSPDSPVIYVTPILKTPHEVPLSISDELSTQNSQNVPIQSTVYDLQHNDGPEMLLQLKSPHASKIYTTAVLDSERQLMPIVPFTLSANSPAAAWDTVPEEKEDISNTYTSTPTPWNKAPEDLLPSTPADAIDVSKTYVQFPTPQNGTSQKLLPSVTPDASKIPVSFTSGPHIPKSRSDHLPSSKATNASEKSTTDPPGTRRSAYNFVKPTTYVQFATDRKYEDTRPKAPSTKSSEKTPDAGDVSTAYAPLATDHNTIPRQLMPLESFDVTETPTTNTLLEETTHIPRATDREYENTTLKEMLPSDAPDANDVSTTNNPLTTEKDWRYYDLSNELFPSEAPNTSNTPSTPTLTTTINKHTKTTPTEWVPSKDLTHWNNVPQHSLTTETPTASKSPTTITSSTSTEEILSSKIADITDKSASTRRTTTPAEFGSAKTPVRSKTPARSTTETYHWSNLPEHLLPSSEPVLSELRTAYTLAPTDRTFVEEESVPSKTSDELGIPVALIYDSNTPEQLPTSPQPDTSEISTANNQIDTDWVTVTEEPVHSVEPGAFKLPTTEIPNDLIKTRNGKPEEILFSEDLDTVKVPTVHTPGRADWNAYPGESVPSVESNVVEIPTSKILNDWNKPEEILPSGDLDTSKVPTTRNSVPTDWISITRESRPSLKTSLPDYWNKPKQLLFSEEPGTFEVPKAYSSIPVGWAAVTDKLKPSIKPNDFTIPTTGVRNNRNDIPERWQSYTQRLNTEYDQSMLLNFEGTTPEEQYYIIQVINVLMPDLLRLYYSKCYKEVDEEMLKRLKAAINSVRQESCDASQRYN